MHFLSCSNFFELLLKRAHCPELARPRPRPVSTPGHDMSGFEAQGLTTGARLYPGLVCEFWVWAEIPGTVTVLGEGVTCVHRCTVQVPGYMYQLNKYNLIFVYRY